jgi:ABC-2 type transport system ATP-binding protein
MENNGKTYEIVLKAEKIRKSYKGLAAVDGLDLEIRRGEIFGLLGPNGAGKSTTIECILGTKKMDEGKVKLLGMDPIKDRKRLFEKVGVQFQQSSYQDKIKVKEVCMLTAALYTETADYEELLQEFHLLGKQRSLVNELSGGEKQKLSIVLAVLNNPDIVFLDELTTGLDPKARREMWHYIELLKARGTTIFLTSHYMDEVEYLCDRICILNKGRVAAQGTPERIKVQSQQEKLEGAYLFYTEKEVM